MEGRIEMAKTGAIKHYRQAGATAKPASLPYSELAVAKDGTLYAGNESNAAVLCSNKVYVCPTTAAGWTAQADGSYAQTVAAAGVTASSVLSSAIVGVNGGGLTLAQKQAIAEALGYISELVPGADSITFVCYDSVPEVDMTVQVTEVR